jgi:hypothetical protein
MGHVYQLRCHLARPPSTPFHAPVVRRPVLRSLPQRLGSSLVARHCERHRRACGGTGRCSALLKVSDGTRTRDAWTTTSSSRLRRCSRSRCSRPTRGISPKKWTPNGPRHRLVDLCRETRNRRVCGDFVRSGRLDLNQRPFGPQPTSEPRLCVPQRLRRPGRPRRRRPWTHKTMQSVPGRYYRLCCSLCSSLPSASNRLPMPSSRRAGGSWPSRKAPCSV